MDNSKDRTNENARPAGDSSARPAEERKPAGVEHSADGSADGTLRSSPFVGTRGQVQSALSARDIVELVLHHKWTILIVFALVTVPALAVIWTLVDPEFQAKAEVRVRPIIPFLVFKTEDSGAIPLYDSYVNTQVSIIGGVAVLQRALDQQEVQQAQWYKNPPKSLVQRLTGNPPAPRDRLKSALSARPRKGTEIIDITFTDRSAKDAQLILNAVLDQYMQYLGYMSDATQDKLSSQLVEQYRSLENEIMGREQVAAELRQQLGTATPEELVSGQRIRLDEAQARLAEVKQSIKVLEWEITQAESVDSNDAKAARQLKYYDDAEWRRLDGNVRSLRHAIDTSILTDKHPDAIQARKDLAFSEELLRLREGQLDEQWANQPKNADGLAMATAAAGGQSYQDSLPTLKYRLDRVKYEEQLLDTELKARQKEFDDLFGRAQLLEKENLDLQHKRELFDAVRQRRDQKNVERNVPASIEVLTRAALPSESYNDRRITFTAMTMVLALGLGGGAAFRKESRNKAIYAPRDLPYPMQVPFLGNIPEAGTGSTVRGSLRSRYDAVRSNRSRIIESVRVVRTALLSRLNGHAGTVILITSAASGTGKSTFTVMLARSLAQAGKKVLLIDADFRKMTLTRHFKNLSDQSGFIQSLRFGSVHKRHIFQTETSGLNIVPAGKRGDGNEVFEEIAGALRSCIAGMRQQYAVILLDSPAVLPLADAAILAGQVDGTIMVERELVSRRDDVLAALARLGSAGGRLLGTVFIGSASREEYS